VARRRDARTGFTLIEILVSAALVGLVMALAVRGFSEAKKLGDMAKGRAIARQEAVAGVQKLARILSRCHLIYFDARPLQAITAAPTSVTDLNSIREAQVPASLRTDTVAGATIHDPGLHFGATTTSEYISPFRDFLPGTTARSAFRVRPLNDTVAGFENTTDNTNNLILAPGEFPRGARTSNIDHAFPAPLLYCAEASLAVGRPDTTTGELRAAGYPVTWTFYLVYLAPMRFEKADRVDDGNGLFPVQEAGPNRSVNANRDLGRRSDDTSADRSRWTRATVPYELRLLTIPDVMALTLASPIPAPTNPNMGAVPPTTGIVMGRRFDTVNVLEVPFDVPSGVCNYDPVPLPATADHGLSTTHPTYQVPASGERVRGMGVHGNWNNVGNDPPSEQCFANRQYFDQSANALLPARDVTDVSIASYIDPDSVHGTCVRLGNDWLRKSGNVGLIAKGEANPRPYVNAMGGPQKYQPSWWNADNPDVLSEPPKRALVSVSTRFRYTRQTPFAFATESVEVDLEALQRFQTTARMKRN
jgi:prepilin-type N-terminal cleavage/methylation domain-containing protein